MSSYNLTEEEMDKMDRITIFNHKTGEKIYANPNNCFKLFESLKEHKEDYSLIFPINDYDKTQIQRYRNSLIAHISTDKTR